MRLKKLQDIDRLATLPEGVVFRKELIWAKIHNRNTKKRLWLKFVSIAACFILLSGGLWWMSPYNMPKENALLTTTVQEPDFDIPLVVVLDEPTTSGVDSKEFENINKETPEKISIPEIVEIKEIPLKPVPSEPERNLPQIFRVEQSTPEPLSPSAQALKKSLAKLKSNERIQEKLVVEKLSMEQMLKARNHFTKEKSVTNRGQNIKTTKK
ncbi:hypothetical protein P872_13395 [Rhodonellum psychrophilum GCM71 = DSM 17998]|uniref:Uncharacterized protein n=2 Tax=Rhodonellum TaxID=336827 RepID=U5BWU9_9BACT|nr:MULTISPECIES: hypothetical protein [Rhodonellum]ERM80377.1 hypothetical protein P872_13395 [Rhodonellum psychrophilum GCM71 = DSM 17998]SDY70639.1 hypothetical protein SAMN05444412_102311 [Rhodonellum ikkaensis]